MERSGLDYVIHWRRENVVEWTGSDCDLGWLAWWRTKDGCERELWRGEEGEGGC